MEIIFNHPRKHVINAGKPQLKYKEMDSWIVYVIPMSTKCLNSCTNYLPLMPLVAYGAYGNLSPSTLTSDNIWDKCELRCLLFCLVPAFSLVCGIPYLFLALQLICDLSHSQKLTL